MARKKDDFTHLLFLETSSNGMSAVLREMCKLLDNPNITLEAGDIDTATMLRDAIRDTLRHRAVMKQTVFNSK